MAFDEAKSAGQAPLMSSPGNIRFGFPTLAAGLKDDLRPEEALQEKMQITSCIRAGNLMGVSSLLVLFAAEAKMRMLRAADKRSSAAKIRVEVVLSLVKPREREMMSTFQV